jgi:hypothetical protein
MEYGARCHLQLYRLIPLTQGKWATVDATDYAWLSQWKWHASYRPERDCYYAIRRGAHPVYMHRAILGLEHGDPRWGDHIEPPKTLDNRRLNLRVGSAEQGIWNRRRSRNNTSGFKGVYWRKDLGLWRSQICAAGVRIHLGYRTTAEAAYTELYVPACLRYHGEFARIA